MASRLVLELLLAAAVAGVTAASGAEALQKVLALAASLARILAGGGVVVARILARELPAAAVGDAATR
jgi:hypothetical protein